MSNKIPYDTGKVKIGCLYNPPQRVVDLGKSATQLQAALLGIRTPLHKRMLARWFHL
jgi:hypothetical protein